MTVKSYDSRSYDLAEIFLEDTPHLNTERRRDELAKVIQTAIEDYLTDAERNYEPPDPMNHVAVPFAENH